MNNIIHGDCQKVMATLPDNSVDCVVTDPPYGYGFMGKNWDKVVPSVDIWTECLRVLKPGAFAFIMSAPRQDVFSHMIINLDKAGFDTSFTSIYWTYATGFPKALNVGKAVDKKNGVHNPVLVPTKKGNTKSDRGTTYSTDTHTGFKDISEIVSEDGKKLNGSYGGFQPKPAVEIIIVVMKPLSEKSYTEQALNNGKGITWLDDVRIPTSDMVENHSRGAESAISKGKYGDSKAQETHQTEGQQKGRFPANLIVSQDALNDGKIYAGQQGEVTGDEESKFKRGNTHGDYSGVGNPMKPRNDAGSFSRYYDLDAWWEERINSLPANVKETFPFLITPKATKIEKNFGVSGEGKFMDESREVGSIGGSNPRNRGAESKSVNHHPTVKPIKLMSYLITLGSRQGDIILDPFCGSGTTLIAAKMIERNFIGIELNQEYHDIAKQRLLPFTSQNSLFENIAT